MNPRRSEFCNNAQPAREVVRGLIERVSVSWEDGRPVVALDGALTALIGLAQNAKGPAVAGPYGSSVKVVAGAGFEPAAFRL